MIADAFAGGSADADQTGARRGGSEADCACRSATCEEEEEDEDEGEDEGEDEREDEGEDEDGHESRACL